MTSFQIGLQPYTIRDAMAEDYIGSLKKVAALGFQGVELGGPPTGMTVHNQKTLCDDLGLHVISKGFPFDSVDVNLKEFVDDMDTLNTSFAMLSMRFDSKKDVLSKAAKLNEAGEVLHKRGKTLLYHNHDWEFQTFDGEYVLDILMRETNPECVQLELDTYWVQKGGVDPASYIEKYKQRCPLLHIKDMEAGDEGFFAEIGQGVLDFASILEAAKEAGTSWLIVEQDQCRRDPFESLAISLQQLKQWHLMP
ncbi:sugar phosphate isomerase/epimerase family protein [Aureibacillus halotolerans]|uniref:Sugar phosphate isomerase/epimerase n=1 Tax=Aureibacillus halotolerans TaxID=1508390 RepID=A0A4R6U3N0_9BACI|nr:sugar phosphate isomerase/epimerase [Aureibacillus halotolerans]TDQ41010.1 sugar phosphate isomerase/epimerase [Aureibacillus halotolerans]